MNFRYFVEGGATKRRAARSHNMPLVMIRCPTTGETISTRHTMNEAQFAGEAFENAAVRCASCNQVHRWHKADAWLQPFRSLRPAPAA